MDLSIGQEIMGEFLLLPRRCQDIFMSYILSDNNAKREAIYDWLICFDFIGSYNMEMKSPIEKIFAMAYDLQWIEKYGFPHGEIFAGMPQKKIVANGNTYYADFLFSVPTVEDGHFNLIVECDGHDFHERTKKQVEYGNNRDYDLKNAGYEIFHFSGSQIYRDPFGCAEKVLVYLKNKMGGDNGK